MTVLFAELKYRLPFLRKGAAAVLEGGISYLLTILTCGIYGFFWAYKMGEKRDIIANENGSSHLLYMILIFLGLGIVVYGLAQDSLNKAIDG